MWTVIAGSDKAGSGRYLDMDRVMEANKLYNQLPSHDRDDAMAMQYLIPNWKSIPRNRHWYANQSVC